MSGDRTPGPEPSRAVSLPADRAFVVQFRAGMGGPGQEWVGRVEHVVSGRAVRFDKCESLRCFIERMLRENTEK